jgi:Mn-dependent DtxR family transcriptional regulator
MITCRKECELSHAERLVLSLLVYKARDKAGVGTKTITRVLGLDRRTVWAATNRLVHLGFIEKTEQGYKALDPIAVRPEWFADPHEKGDWWERVKTYPHYFLTETAKRSRGNRGGILSEMDNAVLWVLYFKGKGGREIVGQRVSGLATMLGCSPHTVRDALGRLSKARLLMIRSDGFTLLDPEASVLSWWRDTGKKEKSAAKEQAGNVQIAEKDDDDHFGWITPLVAKRYGGETEDQRDYVVRMLRKCCDRMLAGRVKPSDTVKYWQEVLESLPDCDIAFNFCVHAWDLLWKDAFRTHTSHGKYAGSCIHLLTANTRTHLSTPSNNLLSLFGG